ncbi:hypothetical protein [Pseudomonas nitroreducens]|uniref:hypothetical protein n=1 Tax=Pseudomonas nitroreducens TaxID=46680 RepID=UPI0026580FFA|nr:hypothetical protein [Pseudomonas nitroreducens]MCP1647999.1 hypothetical protein [Pseudomonas nitroreducens]MCP1686575.1 hypothetical protein [Pseudomonas nitroreducens]
MKALISAVLLASSGLMGVAGQASAADEIGVPGPRNCFFKHGPVSGDPYANAAYPDAATAYWAAMFNTPEGAKLEIKGQFPHSRYISFISYDEKGVPIESVADYLIKPQPGSTNPFVAGAARDGKQRDYRLTVLNQSRDAGEESIGKLEQDGAGRSLHAPTSKAGQQIVLYRIYASDKGLHPTGGVDVPVPVLTLKDGTVLEGQEACQALHAEQPPRLNVAAIGIPKSQYLALLNQPGKPDTHPAQETPEWHIQLDRKALIGMYTGDIDPNARRSEGGFFPNLDNQYIRTIINNRFGDVLVIRGKAPTTPTTFKGDKRMGSGEMRYWSMCSNQGFANTRVNDCVFDEKVPLDAKGYYTIMVSKKKDRPRVAHTECGIAWLPIADDGDGVKDPDVAVVQLRNMLTSPDFKHGVNSVDKDSDIAKVMGEYAPKGMYMQRNIIETVWTCPKKS